MSGSLREEEMIDRRSEEGITIGLIDAMIAVARVLAPRLREVDNQTSNVREALKDVATDEDFQLVEFLSQCFLS
jgi:hypothetical protein